MQEMKEKKSNGHFNALVPYKTFYYIYIYIYIYIYKTEAFEAPTIFHVSTIFKLNLN